MSLSIEPRSSKTCLPFGTRLRQARLAKGLSLRVLAKLMGVSHEYIHQVEKGYCKAMKPEHHTLLASFLGVPVEEWAALLEETPYKHTKPFYTPPEKRSSL